MDDEVRAAIARAIQPLVMEVKSLKSEVAILKAKVAHLENPSSPPPPTPASPPSPPTPTPEATTEAPKEVVESEDEESVEEREEGVFVSRVAPPPLDSKGEYTSDVSAFLPEVDESRMDEVEVGGVDPGLGRAESVSAVVAAVSDAVDHLESGGKEEMVHAGEYDWNGRFQRASEMEVGSVVEELARAAAVHRVVGEFLREAKLAARKIVEEQDVGDEERTVKRVGAGGVAGGEKFQHHGVFFKLARDWVGLYGSDAEAAKAAGLERVALAAVGKVQSKLVRTPLLATMDFNGFRFSAAGTLPIRGDTSLVYGSADAAKTVMDTEPSLSAAMRELGGRLNLAPHAVGSDHTLISACADIEVHKGTDGRYYMLDAARLFPPEAPPRSFQGFLLTSEDAAGIAPLDLVGEEGVAVANALALPLDSLKKIKSVGGTLWVVDRGGGGGGEGGKNSGGAGEGGIGGEMNRLASDVGREEVFGDAVFVPTHKSRHLTRCLRPELVQQSFRALSSDAYSRFGMHDATRHNAAVLAATRDLDERAVPQLANRLALGRLRPVHPLQLVRLMHEAGVNVRRLGVLRTQIASVPSRPPGSDASFARVRAMILVDMLARCAKNELRHGLRSVAPGKEAVRIALNSVLGENEKASIFWRSLLRTAALSRFGGIAPALDDKERRPSFPLKARVAPVALAQTLTRQLGALLRPAWIARAMGAGVRQKFETARLWSRIAPPVEPEEGKDDLFDTPLLVDARDALSTHETAPFGATIPPHFALSRLPNGVADAIDTLGESGEKKTKGGSRGSERGGLDSVTYFLAKHGLNYTWSSWSDGTGADTRAGRDLLSESARGGGGRGEAGEMSELELRTMQHWIGFTALGDTPAEPIRRDDIERIEVRARPLVTEDDLMEVVARAAMPDRERIEAMDLVARRSYPSWDTFLSSPTATIDRRGTVVEMLQEDASPAWAVTNASPLGHVVGADEKGESAAWRVDGRPFHSQSCRFAVAISEDSDLNDLWVGVVLPPAAPLPTDQSNWWGWEVATGKVYEGGKSHARIQFPKAKPGDTVVVEVDTRTNELRGQVLPLGVHHSVLRVGKDEDRKGVWEGAQKLGMGRRGGSVCKWLRADRADKPRIADVHGWSTAVVAGIPAGAHFGAIAWGGGLKRLKMLYAAGPCTPIVPGAAWRVSTPTTAPDGPDGAVQWSPSAENPFPFASSLQLAASAFASAPPLPPAPSEDVVCSVQEEQRRNAERARTYAALVDRVFGKDSSHAVSARVSVAEVMEERGESDEAAKMVESAFLTRDESDDVASPSPPSPSSSRLFPVGVVIRGLEVLGRVRLRQGKPAAAEMYLTRALAALRTATTLPIDNVEDGRAGADRASIQVAEWHPRSLRVVNVLCEALLNQDRARHAAPLVSMFVALWRNDPLPLPANQTQHSLFGDGTVGRWLQEAARIGPWPAAVRAGEAAGNAMHGSELAVDFVRKKLTAASPKKLDMHPEAVLAWRDSMLDLSSLSSVHVPLPALSSPASPLEEKFLSSHMPSSIGAAGAVGIVDRIAEARVEALHQRRVSSLLPRITGTSLPDHSLVIVPQDDTGERVFGQDVYQVGVCAATKVMFCVKTDGSVTAQSLGPTRASSLSLALGDATEEIDASIPSPIRGLRGRKIVSVACGRNFTLFLDSNGAVLASGQNDFGQLGTGDLAPRGTPRLIQGPLEGVPITDISVGTAHAMARDARGRVWVWGRGEEGQLGAGWGVPMEKSAVPRLLKGYPGRCARIHAGENCTFVVTTDGVILACGGVPLESWRKRPALSTLAPFVQRPQRSAANVRGDPVSDESEELIVDTTQRFVDVCFSRSSVAAIDPSGRVWIASRLHRHDVSGAGQHGFRLLELNTGATGEKFERIFPSAHGFFLAPSKGLYYIGVSDRVGTIRPHLEMADDKTRWAKSSKQLLSSSPIPQSLLYWTNTRVAQVCSYLAFTPQSLFIVHSTTTHKRAPEWTTSVFSHPTSPSPSPSPDISDAKTSGYIGFTPSATPSSSSSSSSTDPPSSYEPMSAVGASGYEAMGGVEGGGGGYEAMGGVEGGGGGYEAMSGLEGGYEAMGAASGGGGEGGGYEAMSGDGGGGESGYEGFSAREEEDESGGREGGGRGGYGGEGAKRSDVSHWGELSVYPRVARPGEVVEVRWRLPHQTDGDRLVVFPLENENMLYATPSRDWLSASMPGPAIGKMKLRAPSALGVCGIGVIFGAPLGDGRHRTPRATFLGASLRTSLHVIPFAPSKAPKRIVGPRVINVQSRSQQYVYVDVALPSLVCGAPTCHPTSAPSFPEASRSCHSSVALIPGDPTILKTLDTLATSPTLSPPHSLFWRSNAIHGEAAITEVDADARAFREEHPNPKRDDLPFAIAPREKTSAKGEDGDDELVVMRVLVKNHLYLPGIWRWAYLTPQKRPLRGVSDDARAMAVVAASTEPTLAVDASFQAQPGGMVGRRGGVLFAFRVDCGYERSSTFGITATNEPLPTSEGGTSGGGEDGGGEEEYVGDCIAFMRVSEKRGTPAHCDEYYKSREDRDLAAEGICGLEGHEVIKVQSLRDCVARYQEVYGDEKQGAKILRMVGEGWDESNYHSSIGLADRDLCTLVAGRGGYVPGAAGAGMKKASGSMEMDHAFGRAGYGVIEAPDVAGEFAMAYILVAPDGTRHAVAWNDAVKIMEYRARKDELKVDPMAKEGEGHAALLKRTLEAYREMYERRGLPAASIDTALAQMKTSLSAAPVVALQMAIANVKKM